VPVSVTWPLDGSSRLSQSAAENMEDVQGAAAVLQASDDGGSDLDLGGSGTGDTTPSTSTNEGTESAVPDTGTTEISIALMVSVIIVTFGWYFVSNDPRKYALSSFEDRVKKNL